MSAVDTRIGAAQEAPNTPYAPTQNVPQSDVQAAITAVAALAVAAQATADAINANDGQIALKAAVFN